MTHSIPIQPISASAAEVFVLAVAGDKSVREKRLIASPADVTGRTGWRSGHFHISLRFRNPVSVHEVFEPGGKIGHHPGCPQVKCPLKVLVIIKHPNVDLDSDACTEGMSAFPTKAMLQMA